MDKNVEYKKVTSWDWKQKLGLFLCILTLFFLIISLILFGTAIFNDHFNNFLGKGFWSLKHYGIINLFYNWDQLDIEAAKNTYVSHPFEQVYFAIIFLIIIVPICFVLGVSLLVRGWWKSRI